MRTPFGFPSLLLLAGACTAGDNGVKVADDPPEVAIISPIEGQVFDPTAPVEFCLSVADNQTVENLRLVAQSTVDGEFWTYDQSEPTDRKSVV